MAKKTFFSKLVANDIEDESGDETSIPHLSFDTEESVLESDYQFPDEEQEYDDSNQDWSPDYEGQLMVDVFQTKDDVIIQTFVAGVEVDDIDITIANDKVTIEGERRREGNIPLDDYFYQECYWGPFSRSIVLPVDVDVDSVDAKLNKGILTVTLPKAEKAKVRKIQIKKSNE